LIILKAIALCATKYEPCSIFICTIGDETNNNGHKKDNKQLAIQYTLSGQHEGPITSFDWSCSSSSSLSSSSSSSIHRDTYNTHGQIVTCGEDCRVFVWTFQHHNSEKRNHNENEQAQPTSSSSSSFWIVTQVLLQQNVCTTPLDCQWDASGKYFAMAMGGNQRTASVEICSYENYDIGWTTRQIGRRRFKSSVLCIAWRPDNHDEDVSISSSCGNKNQYSFVACGGCDYRCRIFCVRDDCDDGDNRDCGINFGDQCAEFNTEGKGWIVAMTWSKSGRYLAFTSQKSCVYIVDCSGLDLVTDSNCESCLKGAVPMAVNLSDLNSLPMRSILFMSETVLLGGGYDGRSVIIKRHEDKNEWVLQEGNREACLQGNCKPKENETLSSILCLKIRPSQSVSQKEQCHLISVSGSGGLFDLCQITK
jgi:hypothetical protein